MQAVFVPCTPDNKFLPSALFLFYLNPLVVLLQTAISSGREHSSILELVSH